MSAFIHSVTPPSRSRVLLSSRRQNRQFSRLNDLHHLSPLAIGSLICILYFILPSVLFYAALLFYFFPLLGRYYDHLYLWAEAALNDTNVNIPSGYNSLPSLIVATRPLIADSAKLAMETAVWTICWISRQSKNLKLAVDEANHQFEVWEHQNAHSFGSNSMGFMNRRGRPRSRTLPSASKNNGSPKKSLEFSGTSSRRRRDDRRSDERPHVVPNGTPMDEILDTSSYAVVEPLQEMLVNSEPASRATSRGRTSGSTRSRRNSSSDGKRHSGLFRLSSLRSSPPAH